MLIEFSFENFLSIKDKITLTLLASKDTSNDHSLIKTPSLKPMPLLKTAAVYGANASGKSNVLKAISFFKHFILHSHKMQQGDEIKIVPFKLDENCIAQPSRFEIVFIFAGVRYAYGFSADKQKIHEEYLYHFPKGRQAVIFERNDTHRYTFTADKKEQKELSSRTPQNILYLSSATQWNYQKTAIPFEWLRKHLRVVTSHEKMSFLGFTAEMLSQNPGMIETVNRYLLEADLGINEIKVSKEAPRQRDTPSAGNGEWREWRHTFPGTEIITLHTQHVGIDKQGNEKNLFFKFEEESDGTQKFFSLLGPFIDVLKNGYVLFIDELEVSLHPHLTKFPVALFHSPVQNANGAQLIFTTHDTNLLNLLRRDQVWFTEKNPKNGSTDLYSLMEFSPRKDQNIEKGYLAGRYGAVPFMGGGNIL